MARNSPPIPNASNQDTRLRHPFNALLLEQQPNCQHKRVAAEQEIIVPGVPDKTDPKDIRAKLVEIV